MGHMHMEYFLKEIEWAIKERVEKQNTVMFVSESSNSKEKQILIVRRKVMLTQLKVSKAIQRK